MNDINKKNSILKKILVYYKQYGFKFTFFIALRYCYNYIYNKFFDIFYNIETSDIVQLDKIETKSFYKNNAAHYAPSPINLINISLFVISNIRYKPEIFIDIGCGKGRVVFLAAKSRKFKKIIGIDFDPNLVHIAYKNLSKIKHLRYKNTIFFYNFDAANYLIKEEKQCLIYFFNPFDEFILELFLKNNIVSFKKYHHIIVYLNDKYKEILIKMGFINIYNYTDAYTAINYKNISFWIFL